jgi:FAD synthase
MGPVAAVIGAVASVAGAGAAIVGTKKAAKASQKAADTQIEIAKEQQKQQEIVYKREQRSAIREGQIRRAQGIASAQAAGVSGGSIVGGGMASVGSQVGSTLGFGTQLSGLSSNITDLGIKASQFTQQANRYGAIAQIGGNVFQAVGGPTRLQNMFG